MSKYKIENIHTDIIYIYKYIYIQNIWNYGVLNMKQIMYE